MSTTNTHSHTELKKKGRVALAEIQFNPQVTHNNDDDVKIKLRRDSSSSSKKRNVSSVLGDNDNDNVSVSKKLKIYRDDEDTDLADNEKTLVEDIGKEVVTDTWRNLDLLEKNDVSMVAEYSNDIFTYLYNQENIYQPTHNYLQDPESPFYIRPSMRAILVDWLVEVHEKFSLVPETLLLGINIMDRFLSFNKATVSKLQLLAVTSLFIAAKFEEVNLPTVTTYSYITDGAASIDDIKSAELFILKSLKFQISWPNPLNFLRRISKVDGYKFETRNMGKFLLEYIMSCPRFVSLKPVSYTHLDVYKRQA